MTTTSTAGVPVRRGSSSKWMQEKSMQFHYSWLPSQRRPSRTLIATSMISKIGLIRRFDFSVTSITTHSQNGIGMKRWKRSWHWKPMCARFWCKVHHQLCHCRNANLIRRKRWPSRGVWWFCWWLSQRLDSHHFAKEIRRSVVSLPSRLLLVQQSAYASDMIYEQEVA